MQLRTSSIDAVGATLNPNDPSPSPCIPGVVVDAMFVVDLALQLLQLNSGRVLCCGVWRGLGEVMGKYPLLS